MSKSTAATRTLPQARAQTVDVETDLMLNQLRHQQLYRVMIGTISSQSIYNYDQFTLADWPQLVPTHSLQLAAQLRQQCTGLQPQQSGVLVR